MKNDIKFMRFIIINIFFLFILKTAHANARHPIFETLDSTLGEDILYFTENNYFESKNEEVMVRKLHKELTESLTFLENAKLERTTPLYREFFKTGPLDFLFENIKEFEWDNLLGAPTAPIAAASGPDQIPSINIGFNFLKPQFSIIEKASILIHEARHNQSDRFDHIDCPANFPYFSSSGLPLAGKAACEKIYDGSYGVQIVFLRNISKYCTNCSDKIRKVAQEKANDYLRRIINKAAQEKLLKD